MAFSLETDLPCAAANLGVRPCGAESTKVSRAKKRKLRDRRVAVRHAIRNSSHLQQALQQECEIEVVSSLILGSDKVDHLVSIQATLQVLVPCLQQVLQCLLQQSVMTEWPNPGKQVDQVNEVLTYLNPEATEFFPMTSLPSESSCSYDVRDEVPSAPAGTAGKTLPDTGDNISDGCNERDEVPSALAGTAGKTLPDTGDDISDGYNVRDKVPSATDLHVTALGADVRSLPPQAWREIYARFDCECTDSSGCESVRSEVIPCSGSAGIVENQILHMLLLCQEEYALGPWSRMSPESRNRVHKMRGEMWDHLEAICANRGISPTPESLSSVAGGIPGMYSDIEPDLEEFRAIVWAEIQQM